MQRIRIGRIASVGLCAAVLLAFDGNTRAAGVPDPGSVPADAPSGEPIAPLPLSIPVDPKRAQLGERLFGDARLSGDDSRACSHCHPLEKGGMDGQMRAIARDGQPRLRNTPTLFNVTFNAVFNWDGKAATLEEHARLLLTNPDVMNATDNGLVAKLSGDPGYVRDFRAAFSDGLTWPNVLAALAEFERSLITPGSRFDRFLRNGPAELTEEERQGYQMFKTYGCIACHQGINLGGNLFQRFGVFGEPVAVPPAKSTDDPGRGRITSVERDRGVFRVPSLRNVAVTAPYFHDGRAPNLETAVETMARVQLGRELSPAELRAITRFLGTLTGEFRGQALITAGAPSR